MGHHADITLEQHEAGQRQRIEHLPRGSGDLRTDPVAGQ